MTNEEYMALVAEKLGPVPQVQVPGTRAPVPGEVDITGRPVSTDRLAVLPMQPNVPLNLAAPPAPPPPPAAPEAAPAPVAPPAPAAPAPPQMNPNELVVRPMAGSGGVMPAREMDLRGPSLVRAQKTANQAAETAVQHVDQRSEQSAQHDFDIALQQERQARAREAAFEASAAEREEELARTQHDFSTSVQALGKMSMDPNRFWASRSTGQKIGAFIGLALGGFVQGARGGPNAALDMLNMQVDRDLRAQEFAYQAQRDKAQGKQTAFAMAMQKYNNVDAARAMARAAALDGVQAQLAQSAAMWKGTEAGNRAEIALAQIEQTKMEQIAQGVRFIPSQLAPRMYEDPRYPGVKFTEAEIKQLIGKQDEREFERQKIGMGVAGDVIKEGAKAQFAGQQQQVQLPNGDVIRAPSPAEATELRKMAASVSNAQQLVAQAKAIRDGGSSWRIPGSADRAKLESIQSELTLAFKDRGGLGALSGPDMDLALNATGDITSNRPNAGARLDTFMSATNAALRNRVKTIPDAPASAKGEAPASFKKAGSK